MAVKVKVDVFTPSENLYVDIIETYIFKGKTKQGTNSLVSLW